MFAFKSKYFLIIENIKDFDFKKIKKINKFTVIYRNNSKIEDFDSLTRFRNTCRVKQVKFFVANDQKLATRLKADGIYISAFNKDLKFLNLRKKNFKIMGSAHNIREINQKNIQGCSEILLSKLFQVDYDKKTFLGIIKFNYYLHYSKKLIPLGGIKETNLNSLKNVNCTGFAISSEIKKKPAKIISRLF